MRFLSCRVSWALRPVLSVLLVVLFFTASLLELSVAAETCLGNQSSTSLAIDVVGIGNKRGNGCGGRYHLVPQSIQRPIHTEHTVAERGRYTGGLFYGGAPG